MLEPDPAHVSLVPRSEVLNSVSRGRWRDKQEERPLPFRSLELGLQASVVLFSKQGPDGRSPEEVS